MDSFEQYFDSIKVGSSQTDTNEGETSNPFSNIDMGTIMKMKNIMDKVNTKKDDSRSTLLRSLKPYMRESRKEKIDQYIQLFGMTQLFDGFNLMNLGGEKKK